MAAMDSDLPLLHKTKLNAAASGSTLRRAVREDRYRLRTVGSVLGWIAVGGCASALLQHNQATDFTHNGLQPHAVQMELDALAMTSSACASPDAQAPVNLKPKGWFLGGPDPEVRLSTLPEVTDLPEHWDWRDFNGTGISLTTSVMNQMVPKPCGSCWAFGTVSALSDRIRIAQFRKSGRLPTEVVLTPQPLLDCGMRSFGSCSGGDPRYAHKWIHEHGIVDVTCNPYIASHPSWPGGHDCAASQCRQCNLDGDCHVVEDAKRYHISEYGTLNSTNVQDFVREAMHEIYLRGPIVVSMYSLSPEYRNYKGGYVLRDATKYPGTTHVVSLVGWGTDDHGVKYWIVRNSDGTNWGENGFFRAERGVNIYNIETHGAWAVPIMD